MCKTHPFFWCSILGQKSVSFSWDDTESLSSSIKEQQLCPSQYNCCQPSCQPLQLSAYWTMRFLLRAARDNNPWQVYTASTTFGTALRNQVTRASRRSCCGWRDVGATFSSFIRRTWSTKFLLNQSMQNKIHNVPSNALHVVPLRSHAHTHTHACTHTAVCATLCLRSHHMHICVCIKRDDFEVNVRSTLSTSTSNIQSRWTSWLYVHMRSSLREKRVQLCRAFLSPGFCVLWGVWEDAADTDQGTEQAKRDATRRCQYLSLGVLTAGMPFYGAQQKLWTVFQRCCAHNKRSTVGTAAREQDCLLWCCLCCHAFLFQWRQKREQPMGE